MSRAIDTATIKCTKIRQYCINAVLHLGRMWRNAMAITSGIRGIYCKGRESCIIQCITIVGIHDNNCTIIITAAPPSDKPGLCAQLLVWRAYNLSTSENHRGLLVVLEFCLPKSFGSAERPVCPGYYQLKRTAGKYCKRRKISACASLSYVSRYKRRNTAARRGGVILINGVSAPLSIVSNHLLPRRFHPLTAWNTVPFYVCAMS